MPHLLKAVFLFLLMLSLAGCGSAPVKDSSELTTNNSELEKQKQDAVIESSKIVKEHSTDLNLTLEEAAEADKRVQLDNVAFTQKVIAETRAKNAPLVAKRDEEEALVNEAVRERAKINNDPTYNPLKIIVNAFKEDFLSRSIRKNTRDYNKLNAIIGRNTALAQADIDRYKSENRINNYIHYEIDLREANKKFNLATTLLAANEKVREATTAAANAQVDATLKLVKAENALTPEEAIKLEARLRLREGDVAHARKLEEQAIAAVQREDQARRDFKRALTKIGRRLSILDAQQEFQIEQEARQQANAIERIQLQNKLSTGAELDREERHRLAALEEEERLDAKNLAESLNNGYTKFVHMFTSVNDVPLNEGNLSNAELTVARFIDEGKASAFRQAYLIYQNMVTTGKYDKTTFIRMVSEKLSAQDFLLFINEDPDLVTSDFYNSAITNYVNNLYDEAEAGYLSQNGLTKDSVLTDAQNKNMQDAINTTIANELKGLPASEIILSYYGG